MVLTAVLFEGRYNHFLKETIQKQEVVGILYKFPGDDLHVLVYHKYFSIVNPIYNPFVSLSEVKSDLVDLFHAWFIPTGCLFVDHLISYVPVIYSTATCWNRIFPECGSAPNLPRIPSLR